MLNRNESPPEAPSPGDESPSPASDGDTSSQEQAGFSTSWRAALGYVVVAAGGLALLVGSAALWQAHSLYGDRPDGEAKAPALAIPVEGVESLGIVSPWGASRGGGTRMHKGIDIFAPVGTPVVAPRPGTVAGRYESGTAGKHLWLIDENDTHAYLYLHLRRFAGTAPPGAHVSTGDTLGYVGKTGNAIHTPAHLHFGVARLNRTGTLAAGKRKVNPYPYLRESDTEGLPRTLEAMRTAFALFTHQQLGEEWWLPLG